MNINLLLILCIIILTINDFLLANTVLAVNSPKTWAKLSTSEKAQIIILALTIIVTLLKMNA